VLTVFSFGSFFRLVFVCVCGGAFKLLPAHFLDVRPIGPASSIVIFLPASLFGKREEEQQTHQREAERHTLWVRVLWPAVGQLVRACLESALAIDRLAALYHDAIIAQSSPGSASAPPYLFRRQVSVLCVVVALCAEYIPPPWRKHNLRGSCSTLHKHHTTIRSSISSSAEFVIFSPADWPPNLFPTWHIHVSRMFTSSLTLYDILRVQSVAGHCWGPYSCATRACPTLKNANQILFAKEKSS
jgi:hypothetical protein